MKKRKDGSDRAKVRKEIGGHLWEFLEIQRSFPGRSILDVLVVCTILHEEEK